MDPRSLPVARRVNLLVSALDGAQKTNEALAACADGEEILDVLLGASSKLRLGLTREQLRNTFPPHSNKNGSQRDHAQVRREETVPTKMVNIEAVGIFRSTRGKPARLMSQP